MLCSWCFKYFNLLNYIMKKKNTRKSNLRIFIQSKKTRNNWISLPSTDGENKIRLSYKNSPYFTKARLESSAVLNVSSKPRSVISQYFRNWMNFIQPWKYFFLTLIDHNLNQYEMTCPMLGNILIIVFFHPSNVCSRARLKF